MPQGTRESWQEFILSQPRTAKLATVRPDGRPHVAPVWIALDGDTVVFTTMHDTVKAANLRHNPRVMLCVDDEAPPFAFVSVEGVATMSEEPDPEEMLKWTIRIAGRYMGADRAGEFGKRNAVPGEVLVRVTPTHITTQPW
ncbi:MAG: PPOX class F420-dependent oxidoreductase [Dehalococcoidia bacterium]